MSRLPPRSPPSCDFDRPAPDEQGLVLFFTGLSGSGKSTLARALMDRLLEQGHRTVTSLDGDVVRRNLSAGLTFSKADRETNIRRIGWVAAEISRHGGVAVCSPIAPFDETRQQVRAMVDHAGGAFFLVHVATPLEECERRDRKGLYAKARRGEIPEFTGISSPYEEPEDANVRVDTTGRTIDEALDDVLAALADEGYLDLTSPSVVEQRASASVVETDAGPEPVDPLKVLFVCTANICRSPFMELVARQLAGPDAAVEFSSAGTHGFRDHPMDDVMAGTLAAPRHRRPRLLPEPPADLGADRAGRPGAHRRGGPPDLHPRRPPRRLPQGLHPGPVRGGGPGRRPVACPAGTSWRRSGSGAAPRMPPLTWRTPTVGAPKQRPRPASAVEDLLRVAVPALVPTRKITP